MKPSDFFLFRDQQAGHNLFFANENAEDEAEEQGI
jgi:hypothetical protein